MCARWAERRKSPRPSNSESLPGAVTSDLRVARQVQAKILTRLIDLGIPIFDESDSLFRAITFGATRKPCERMVRAYADGVAFMNRQRKQSAENHCQVCATDGSEDDRGSL